MTPEERARKCYRELWVDNGTHSEEFIIAGIARAIREALDEGAHPADEGGAAGFRANIACTECRQAHEVKIYTPTICPNCGNDEFELTNIKTGVA